MDTTAAKLLQTLCEQEEDRFQVLQLPAGWGTSQAPLLLIVHPGDALEFLSDWRGNPAGRGVVALSVANQAGMASEIMQRLPTHEVAVLHRLSSQYLGRRDAESSYRQAVRSAEEVAAVLYGDDLDAASQWLHAHAMPEHRRQVFLTGAYADAQYGCITAIGRVLQAHRPDVLIEVSHWAPTDNTNHAPRWRPDPPETLRRPSSRKAP